MDGGWRGGCGLPGAARPSRYSPRHGRDPRGGGSRGVLARGQRGADPHGKHNQTGRRPRRPGAGPAPPQTPVPGGSSQVPEFRTGHYDGTSYVEPPGGSLNNDRAIDPSIQERVMVGQEVRAFRITPSVMGDGFVEAIDSDTLVAIATAQPAGQTGVVIQVPVVEAPGNNRVGRFGWKNQNCSLLSFAADAYVNEMGITSPMQPIENTSNGNSVAAFDTVADPEDTLGADIASFTLFMRSLKAPPV